ncbi:MAG: hypothetical protein Q9168_007650 [Polycauliona sp. 1 TL-2023]
MGSSSYYSEFTSPIRNEGGASYDIHIYFDGNNDHQVEVMRGMRQAIKDTFPELVLYNIHDKPIGPHPLPMFEVDLFTPAQFGAFLPWLAIHHGSLSILIHPNTGKARLDHTLHAMWIGNKLDLKLDIFDKMEERAKKVEEGLGEKRK